MRTTTTLVAAMSLTAGAALAQTGFDELDANMDDSISAAEYRDANLDVDVFTIRDTDNDGLLSENEYGAMEFVDDDDFAEWDADQDSYLSSDEFYDGAFGYFDENESGHWDGDEWDDAGDEGFWDV